MSESVSVQISIIDQTFTLRSPPGKEAQLRAAAKALDERIRIIKAGGRVVGLDRMAIMAALNLSAENLQLKNEMQILEQSLLQMDTKVKKALNT